MTSLPRLGSLSVMEPKQPICIYCGQTREEHLAGLFCLDSLDETSIFHPNDDPELLQNVLVHMELG